MRGGKFRRGATLLLFALLCTAAVPAGGSAKVQKFRGPIRITVPGTYLLTKSFSVTAGPAISIATNRVVVDLGGHTITHLGTDSVIESECPLADYCYGDIRVTNGTIAGGGRGISFVGNELIPEPFVIDRLDLRNQSEAGIALIVLGYPRTAAAELRLNAISGAPVGVSAWRFRLRLEQNRISDSGTGLNLGFCHGSILSENELTRNELGMYINTSYDLIVDSNVISRNGAGVRSFENYFSLFRGNVFTGNRQSGMHMILFRENVLEENVFSANGGDGVAIYYVSEVNLFLRNRVVDNGGCGIAMDCTSVNNVLSGNRLSGNGQDLCIPEPCFLDPGAFIP